MMYGVRPTQRLVAARGLAEIVLVGHHVADVVGNLVGLADALAEQMPGIRLVSRGGGAPAAVAAANSAPVLAR